jgi:hypothetical protein
MPTNPYQSPAERGEKPEEPPRHSVSWYLKFYAPFALVGVGFGAVFFRLPSPSDPFGISMGGLLGGMAGIGIAVFFRLVIGHRDA